MTEKPFKLLMTVFHIEMVLSPALGQACVFSRGFVKGKRGTFVFYLTVILFSVKIFDHVV